MANKILSWNINGLRSQKTEIKLFLDSLLVDIICLQETKVTRDMLEESYAIVEGYSSYFSFSKKRSGYSGVATFCKNSAAPFSAQDGLSGRDGHCIPGGSVECLSGEWEEELLKNLDTEGRCIITVHKIKIGNADEVSVAIINVYCPRADPEKAERKLFKLLFYELLRQRAEALRKSGAHVVIVGDINTSHKTIDHCDPEDPENFDIRPDRIFLSDFLFEVKVGEAIPTAEILQRNNNPSVALNSNTDEDDINFHSDFRVIDTFRYFHPIQREAFTCWNTKANARATNYGTRIDYALCSMEFITYVLDSQILAEIEGSDHCPITLQLIDTVQFSPSEKLPTICTKYFPEFRGNQQKLQNYFKKQEKQQENFMSGSSKRKLDNNHKSSIKQTKLSSFFNTIPRDINSAKIDDECKKKECNLDSDINESLQESVKTASISKPVANWDFLLKKPKTPPLCTGHKETSVLRTVKKKGPNLNRKFYACSRGIGKSNNPKAQCKFFMWC